MKVIKKKIFGKESRALMMEGINQAADVTGSTMGAKGRNVVLDKDYGSPIICNDGVTIIREIFFEDPIKNMGVQLLKDAAGRTNEQSGDGTTGSVVLARSIMEQGWKAVEEGANPVTLRKELEAAAEKVTEELKKTAEKVTTEEQAVQVARVSVQDVEVGEKIGKMMFSIGAHGAVTLKDSIKRGVFIEKDGGMRLEGQLMSGIVGNANKWETKYTKARILLMKDSIDDHEFETKWLPLLSKFIAVDNNGKVVEVKVPSFILIAEKISNRLEKTMNLNKDTIKWNWFRPTTAGKNMKEIYKDLQSLIGGRIACEEDGVFLSEMSLEDLGVCETATVGRHDLVITVANEQLKEDRYLDRVNEVKGQIDNAEDEIEQEDIRNRYANLTGGVAAVKIAAATDQDTNELRLRIEDAVNATRSAMEEGIVSGGGVALLNAVKTLKGTTGGEKVLLKAGEAAIRQILHNAGYEDVDALLKKLKTGEGIDVLTDETVDMKQAGIIDPLKVIRLSLENAVSVAGLLLTSEYAVTNVPDEVDAVKKFFAPVRE